MISPLRFLSSSTVAAVVSVLLLPGCRGAAQQGSNSEKPVAERATDELDADAIAALERISTLGYVESSPEPAVSTQMGVTVFEESHSYPGYNLYTLRSQRAAELIDARGHVVHRWHHEADMVWVRSVLLDNGDLLVVGKLPGGSPTRSRTVGRGFAMRMSWDNEILWQRVLSAHHDIVATPDGRIGVLTVKGRRPRGAPRSAMVVEDHVTILSQDGEVEEERSLEKMLRARPDIFSFKFEPRARVRRAWDPLHSNSLRWMADPKLAVEDPIYALGNLIVCFRYQDSVAIFDWDRRQVVWAWGRGELSEPHDAAVLDNGNILIFDNGVARRWSRVVELDPLSREIVWEYREAEPARFFTGARGANQRLPNGNTLITESNEGRAFEVTPEGQIVWEYFVPYVDPDGHRQIMIRLYRYDTDLVERLLARPGGGPRFP